MARVKARRCAESAVFLRDMMELEHKMEYDEVSALAGAEKKSPSKILQHRPEYSSLHILNDLDSDSISVDGVHAQTEGGAVQPNRAAPLSTSLSQSRASSCTFVPPRRYLFESPPRATRSQQATPASIAGGRDGRADEDVDYIRQLAAEEFAGLSCYALLGFYSYIYIYIYT
jgi:hypothetical protein